VSGDAGGAGLIVGAGEVSVAPTVADSDPLGSGLSDSDGDGDEETEPGGDCEGDSAGDIE
jgi:hypothetical protein